VDLRTLLSPKCPGDAEAAGPGEPVLLGTGPECQPWTEGAASSLLPQSEIQEWGVSCYTEIFIHHNSSEELGVCLQEIL
jgi:hypothetical protein